MCVTVNLKQQIYCYHIQCAYIWITAQKTKMVIFWDVASRGLVHIHENIRCSIPVDSHTHDRRGVNLKFRLQTKRSFPCPYPFNSVHKLIFCSPVHESVLHFISTFYVQRYSQAIDSSLRSDSEIWTGLIYKKILEKNIPHTFRALFSSKSKSLQRYAVA